MILHLTKYNLNKRSRTGSGYMPDTASFCMQTRRTSHEILLMIYQDFATSGSGVKFAMTVDDLRRRTIYMTADIRAPRRKTAM